MTAPPPAADPQTALAVALAELRGAVSTGFAEIKGSLALLVQRAGQTDLRVDAHDAALAEHDRRLDAAEQKLAAAEEVRAADRRRVQMLSAVVGVVAGVIASLATLLALAR
ncbi:hypothetical protein ACWGB8_07745 [Kitasatospora sp. NPDC054939]